MWMGSDKESRRVMKKVLVMLFLCFNVILAFADGNDKIDKYNVSGNSEQITNDNQEIRIEYSLKELVENLEKDLETNRVDIDNLKRDRIILITVLIVLGIGSVPTLKGFRKFCKNYLQTEVEKEAEEINNIIISEYREKIKSEIVLRRTKKLLVLFQDEYRDLEDKLGKQNLRQYLKHFQFEVLFKELEKISIESTKDYDLIIFADGEKSKDLYINPKAQEIINNSNIERTVFYYHNEYRRNQGLENCYINNSNSFVTLYRNIMDTLEFQEYLVRKENNQA